ncbi:CYTH domain-containing protein [Candidatus Peregrinibacteria bacterium]|nr:CYTH domain-containing protein [Candidatus Peregrinibacteria bacterium]
MKAHKNKFFNIASAQRERTSAMSAGLVGSRAKKLVRKKQEVEIKVLEVSKSVFLKKMREIGAKKEYSVLVKVKYFDFEDRRIHGKRDLLRVREFTFLPGRKQKTEVVYKAYKCVKGGCKFFDEFEFVAEGDESFKNICAFFGQLGFVETVYYEKKRTLFKYKDWKFEFDEHPRIPSFFEIEAKNAKKVMEAVRLLKLEKFEKTPESIGQLLKRKYPEISLNGLVWYHSTVRQAHGKRSSG